MNLAEQRIDADASEIGLSDTTGDANPVIVHGLIRAVHAADGNVSRIWSALCVGLHRAWLTYLRNIRLSICLMNAHWRS